MWLLMLKLYIHCLIGEFACDPNAVGHKGYTLLHYACKSCAMDIVRVLIHDYKADVNEHKNTPLHVAADAGHYVVALTLVSEYYGCDPNAVVYKGRTCS